tara:strand:+ start:1085 stop:1498 length:414 start_codon:yes stop_codon:yes gene_type:complete
MPWSDSVPFGRYLFLELPFLQYLAIPALPLIFIEQIIPLGGIILFLTIFFVIIRNQNISYFLRFNALQSILINIGVIIISYIFQIFLNPFENSLLIRTLSSTVFISMLSIIIFSIYKCIQGKEPDLPGISNSVRIQL